MVLRYESFLKYHIKTKLSGSDFATRTSFWNIALKVTKQGTGLGFQYIEL